jgi:hypothetical protein
MDYEENKQRLEDLAVALYHRLSKSEIFDQLRPLTEELEEVNRKCWQAQETIMQNKDFEDGFDSFQDVAYAALDAQELNAQRNSLIRKIDELLGELDRTPLRKSYGS